MSRSIRKRAPRSPGRLNISWNLWLLIIHPGRALERLLQFDTLFLALMLVAVGGLVQGTALALRMESLMPVILRIVGGYRIEPLVVAMGVLVAFLLLWVLTAAMHGAFGRLIGLPVEMVRLFKALGLAFLPCVFEFTVLPMVLVENTTTFGVVDTAVKAITLPWVIFLHLVALRAGLECRWGQAVAVFLLTAYTLVFLVQAGLVGLAIGLGTSLLGNLGF
jgi:hypothetical protein